MTGIVNSTGARSGVIGTTVAPAVGTGTDGYVLTATGAGAVPEFEAIPAAVSGITEADYWRLTTSFTGSSDPIASNL